MSFFVRGSAFGAIDQPRDTIDQAGDGSFTVTRTYRTVYATWEDTKPRSKSAHPVYRNALLETVNCVQLSECGVLCDVTLKYFAPKEESEVPEGSDTDGQDPPEPGSRLPADEYTESAVEGEAPIEGHPRFNDFATVANGALWEYNSEGKRYFKGWSDTSPFRGQVTYRVKKLTKTETKFFWAKPGSAENLIGQVSGKWLCVSASLSRRGPYWARALNWEYSSEGWNSTIYPV